MKKIFTSFLALASIYVSQAQPIISSGFGTGMAAIDGTAYTHTGNIGTGNFQFVCASKNEPHFFASSFTTNYLYYIDVATNTIVDSFATTMYDITAANENSTLFAVGANNDVLYRFNTASKSYIDSLSLAGIARVKERPGAKEVWCTADNKIHVVDYTSGLSSSTINFAPVSTADGGGVSFTKGGSLGYISCFMTNKVYKINAATKTVTDSTAIPTGSYCAVVTLDSSKVFVSAPNSFRIYTYNAATMALTDSINTGTREPFMLYRHPSRAEIWAVNHFKDSVTVYNANTNAMIATFGISSSPHHLAFSNGATGVKNITAEAANILVYPNPASKVLNLQMPDNKARTVMVYDAYGRCARRLDVNTTHTSLDITGLPAGTYFIAVVQDGRAIKTLNWIKE